MSETSTEKPGVPTFGEVFQREFAAAERRFMRSALEWDELSPTNQASVRAGANAVAAHVANPTAADYDRAAEELAKPPARYALVEQMGHRATYAAIRETTFLGEPVLEVTALNDGSVHLVSPKSIFEVTLMPEDQARNLAARTTSWTAVAIPAAHYADDDQ